MSKPNKIQYNGNSKIIAALVNVGNWLLDNGAYTLPIASASRLGGIKVGSNLTITEEGVLNAQAGGGSDVSVTPIVTTGTKIAKITITEGTSDTDYNLFAPTPSTVNDATITIKKNNTTVDSFTLNQSSNKDINISVPTVTDTYDGTSSDGMSGKAVKSAIDALDGTVTGSAAASKTLTSFSQTDGKVTAEFSDINITKSQVSDFPAIPTKVSDLTNDSGYVTTDEKVTAESVDPSSGSYVGLCVPLVYKEDNQKPKIPTGHVMNVKKGTSSEVGYVSVTLGNSTASGTSGNKFGRLRLYSQKTKYVDLVATSDMTTADRTIYLPDKNGTVALTSDLTTYAFAEGTNNGEIKITPSVGGTAQTAVTVKPKGISDLAYIAKGSGSSKFLREDGTWQTVSGAVSGVKGNAESSYRTGNVNLTPANIGALALSGGTLQGSTGNAPLKIQAGSNMSGDDAKDSWIQFLQKDGTTNGYIGIKSDNKPYLFTNSADQIVTVSYLNSNLEVLYNENACVLCRKNNIYWLRFNGCNKTQLTNAKSSLTAYFPSHIAATLYSINTSINYLAYLLWTGGTLTVKVTGGYGSAATDFFSTGHVLYGTFMWMNNVS